MPIYECTYKIESVICAKTIIPKSLARHAIKYEVDAWFENQEPFLKVGQNEDPRRRVVNSLELVFANVPIDAHLDFKGVDDDARGMANHERGRDAKEHNVQSLFLAVLLLLLDLLLFNVNVLIGIVSCRVFFQVRNLRRICGKTTTRKSLLRFDQIRRNCFLKVLRHS